MMGGSALATETTLGPYRVLDVLGQGGMGVVYRGEHRMTGRLVALKTVRTAGEITLAGIRREIHALGRIEHPGVVKIVDQGVLGGLPWYAMELLLGRTLDSHLRAAWDPRSRDPAPPAAATLTRTIGEDSELPGGLPPAEAAPAQGSASLPAMLSVIRRVCTPLGFLHGEGIVHRDLKPENIFLRPDGSPVIVDLGIAGRFGGAGGREEIAVEGKLMGSLAYMAPEQARAELVDARADLYALGCILYACATGRPPFTGTSAESLLYQHRNVAPIPPSHRAAGIAAALDDLILGLLAKRPQDRIGYADDVASALRALGATDGDPPGIPEARPYLYRPDLAGREDALDALARARGGCVLVGGESGVGKTRLAMEAGRAAAQRGITVIAGQCTVLGGGDRGIAAGPLHPLRPLLLAVADRCRALGAAEAARILGPRGRVLSTYEPSLAELPGQGALPPPASLPPEAARTRVLDALAGTLFAFAEGRRLLLVLDDLQWADDLSLAFVQRLSTADLVGHGVLVVGTYRMEERGDALAAIVRAPGVTSLELGRLDVRGVGAMVSGMLALREPPEVLVDFLARQSDGNPFFIAEYLRAAVLDGMLARSGAGVWRLDERGHAQGSLEASLPLPGALSGLIERRLRDLGEPGHALVRWASVLGREVDAGLFTAAVGLDDDAVMDAIELLRVRQILEETPSGRLRFVHDKIRERAYEGLPLEERRALHRGAAAAIEARYAEAPDFALHHASLGHHWSKAKVPDRAGRYFVLAADRARSAHANGEAIALYREAIHEAQQASPGAEAAARETLARTHESLGDLLALTGREVDARDVYESALARLPPDGGVAPARLHRKMGKSWDTHHQDEHTLRCYALAEACLGAEPHPMEDAGADASEAWWHEWIQIQIARMLLNYWRADVGAMALLVDRTERPVTLRGTPSQRKQFYQMRARTSFRRERFALSDETVGFSRAALVASQESGDPAEIAEATYFWSFTLLFHGRLAEAAEQTLAALAGAERIGDLALQLRCLVYLLIIYRRLRQVEQVRAIVTRTLAVASDSRMIEYVGVAEASLAWIALRDGDLDRADAKARAAIDLWGKTSVVYAFHWLALLPLLAVDLGRDHLEAAAGHAGAMLLPAQHRLPEDLARSLGMGVALVREGRRDDARDALGEAARTAERLGYL